MIDNTAHRLDAVTPAHARAALERQCILLLAAPPHAGPEIVALIRRQRGCIERLSPHPGACRISVRVRARRIDDIVATLEAADFDVLGMVLTGTK